MPYNYESICFIDHYIDNETKVIMFFNSIKPHEVDTKMDIRYMKLYFEYKQDRDLFDLYFDEFD